MDEQPYASQNTDNILDIYWWKEIWSATVFHHTTLHAFCHRRKIVGTLKQPVQIIMTALDMEVSMLMSLPFMSSDHMTQNLTS